MEIISKTALDPMDVIELGDELPTLEPAADLEIVDHPGAAIIPGTEVAIVPGASQPQEKKETDWENDGDYSKALSHYEKRLNSIPAHSGKTIMGIERALKFLESEESELRKAMRTDFNNKIDEFKAEQLLERNWEMQDRLQDALDSLTEAKSKSRRKKASIRVGKEVVARIKDGTDIQYYVEVQRDKTTELLPVRVAEPTDDQVQLFVKGEQDGDGITKEAHTAKIYLFEDPFLHSITRILINAHVSAGRNIEEVYHHLKDKYAFTPREELSIQELLLQKGLPMFKDFGRLGEKDQHISDGKGIEYATEYFS